MSPGEPPIRVLIADDQRVVRDGLTMLVGLLDGVEVVGQAEDGAAAVELATKLSPDVVLMDLRMPGLDGVSATRQLSERMPQAAVLILTTYADDDSLLPALQAGALGYLTKAASAEEIGSAIRAVRAGRTHLDPTAQRRLVQLVAGRPQPRRGEGGAGELTDRELEVLRLIAEGLSNAEIGTRLFVSPATVKSHINRIFAKVGARDRAQAVRYAYEAGIIAPE